MRQYKVFKHPAGATEAVKQGWSWPAFFFSCFWAMAKQMWIIGIALFIASMALGAYVGQAALGDDGEKIINILSVAISIIFGLKGNDWRELNLLGRGYEHADTVTATTPEGAIALFIKKPQS